MYSSVKEFVEDWKIESATTLKLFSVMTDKSLGQRVYAEGRSIGEIACIR